MCIVCCVNPVKVVIVVLVYVSRNLKKGQICMALNIRLNNYWTLYGIMWQLFGIMLIPKVIKQLKYAKIKNIYSKN